MFCGALIPLFWQFTDKGFWSDELYSIYYSRHIWKSIFAEPHLPFTFIWLRIFVAIFGDFSVWINLSSLLPFAVALYLAMKQTEKWGGSIKELPGAHKPFRADFPP
jgi:hypothetical protein